MSKNMYGVWIGVDLDNTLAKAQVPFDPCTIGEVDKRMAYVVETILEAGIEVRIFTSRVAIVPGLRSDHGHCDEEFARRQRELIDAFTMEHFGMVLACTATKDFNCVAILDDISIDLDRGMIRKVDELIARIEYAGRRDELEFR